MGRELSLTGFLTGMSADVFSFYVLIIILSTVVLFFHTASFFCSCVFSSVVVNQKLYKKNDVSRPSRNRGRLWLRGPNSVVRPIMRPCRCRGAEMRLAKERPRPGFESRFGRIYINATFDGIYHFGSYNEPVAQPGRAPDF